MSATDTRLNPAAIDGAAAATAVVPSADTGDALPDEPVNSMALGDRSQQPQPALLVDMAADTLTLHTREAYWIFAGRGFDKAGIQHRIIGGQRAAAVLNALRHASVGGNPYADWFLVCFDEQLTALRTRLADLVGGCEAGFELLKTKGLALNVLGSREPLKLNVAFGSSYGYAIAETVVEFDYYVRFVKTLVLKNRIRPDAGRTAIREIGRLLRRLFVRSIRWERALRSPELQDITRRDYLPDASEVRRARVAAATARFGPIPRSVLDGTTIPPHVWRRIDTGN